MQQPPRRRLAGQSPQRAQRVWPDGDYREWAAADRWAEVLQAVLPENRWAYFDRVRSPFNGPAMS